MYPRIKNTAQKVVYAFQCSRRRQQAPREKLFSTGLAPGPASGTVWGPPTSAAARRGAAPAPGASGPAASPGRQRAPDGTSRAGVAVRDLALQGAAATTSHVSGFMASRSGPSGALGLVGLFQENLAQDDPHRRVCLDGEAQCFQGAKGRVHLTLRHTLVEGADLKVAVRAPRVPEGG